MLILGAGLTGLSVGMALKGKDALIVEKGTEIGGICRSHNVEGFVFDLTGHLLHFSDARAERAVKALLKGNLLEGRRNAGVYCEGRVVDFPFQAHFGGLPWETAKECLLGLMRRPKANGRPKHFAEWIRRQYGDGIARTFMTPYNKKIWNYPLHRMDVDWIDWRVPQVRLEDALDGMFGKARNDFGYNARFYYPLRGGVQALTDAIARKAGRIATGRRATRIDPVARLVRFADGGAVRYERLVNTLPLPTFVPMLAGAPEPALCAARALKNTSVVNVSLGLDGPAATDRHWIYFADPDLIFYRVGVQSHFSPHVAPRGKSSYYVEISHGKSGFPMTDEEVYRRTLADLKKTGLLPKGLRPIAREINRLKFANVIYDLDRRSNLKRIEKALGRWNILSYGRFGRWDYSSISDSIADGFRAADEIGAAGG